MAILKKMEGDGKVLGDYAADLPPGQYEAICVDVHEEHDVQRRKFQSQKMDTVDVIDFEFEVTGKSGGKRTVRTREMKITMHEKSALFKFLLSWFGEPPEDGLDTDNLISCTAKLTLQHAPGKADPDKIFVRIAGIEPGSGKSQGGVA
jgi:hypothetical protein